MRDIHGRKQKKNAQDGLELVKEWLNEYKLSLNVKKTNYIAFSKTEVNRPPFSFIKVNNLTDKIYGVTNTKYLGVVIDQYLKWDLHSIYLTQKLKYLIYKFYTIRQMLNTSILITLYQSLVESILRYGILVWGNMYNNSLRPLQVIQNRILKIIFKKEFLYPTQLLYNKTILNLRTLYFYVLCCYIHKNDKSKCGVHHEYATRINTNKQLSIPRCYSEFSKKSIKYLGPKLYNLLPNHIKSTNIKVFSKSAKCYIVEQNSDFVRVLQGSIV